jgi:hypothetical protein
MEIGVTTHLPRFDFAICQDREYPRVSAGTRAQVMTFMTLDHRTTSAIPFATLMIRMGAAQLVIRRLAKVAIEMALHVLA